VTTLSHPKVRTLLEQPNYAVISTHNPNGSIHSTVVWVDAQEDTVSVNSAVGRVWPANLQRDPRVTLIVFEAGNPYNFLEIRGRAAATLDGADEHINALAKKYMNVDEYPARQPGEQRIMFVITPEHIRHRSEE
jgi:PPOX class probable F420-dependent enzyme